MGCASSKPDNSFALHPPLLEEHVYQLNLPVPPHNGFDSFLTLQWCRDLQEEKEDLERAQKQAAKQAKKSKAGAATPTPQPPPKKYYLCLVGKYEPYQDNTTVNLQKQPDAWKALPQWQDSDYMEDILANGPFYQNDAFLLEHVPTAIRQPADYAYTEQYQRAFQHWRGRPPTPEQVAKHQTRVARTLLTEWQRYQRNNNRDAKGRDRSRTVAKLQAILQSMELDAHILRTAEQEADAVLQAEQEAAAAAAAKEEAEQEKKNAPTEDAPETKETATSDKDKTKQNYDKKSDDKGVQQTPHKIEEKEKTTTTTMDVENK